MSGVVPMHVLSQQIAEALGGRRVHRAVFTTFSFDPGFFELHVLPLLFDQPFAQPDKVRRLQLEDALLSTQGVTVYYDQRALSSDAEPAQLAYRRLDVSRTIGYFHPKLILLLADEHQEEDGTQAEPAGRPQALLVAVMSANLTRAGWWENVECAHVEEIKDRDVEDQRHSFRRDLLSLIKRITAASPGDRHEDLDAMHEFLLTRASKRTFSTVSVGGRFHSRLFCGQRGHSLARFLVDLLAHRRDLNLEIVSPFFDRAGAGPLVDLIDGVSPRETRVYLPTAADGAAQVSAKTYEAIAACESVRWANLPAEVVRRGRSESAAQLPRRVHAKVYRLWRKGGPDLMLVGSPNLTTAGHSQSSAGNLEAAFLVDVTASGPQRWWLDPLDREVERFAEDDGSEHDGLDDVGLPLSLQFDWATGRVSYRVQQRAGEAIQIFDASGRFLFTIDHARMGRWHDCGDEAASLMADVLRASSFVLAQVGQQRWRLLVREEQAAHRPSRLVDLTPEEILHYWSLLTPAQRAYFLERVGGSLEGLPVTKHQSTGTGNTLFDRFAGIYHAFGCLSRSVEKALQESRQAEAEARLFGARFDSLPALLQKAVDRDDSDPIVTYVTFLCARQLRDTLTHRHRDFMRATRARSTALDSLLEHVPAIRARLPLDGPQSDDFLRWYEEMFLAPVGEPFA